jgi:hypothetical protein
LVVAKVFSVASACFLKLACLVNYAPKVSIASRAEHSLDLSVRQPLNEVSLANRCLTTTLLNLLQYPHQILERMLTYWNGVNGVLYCDSSQPLQPSPYLHAQIRRRAGYLVNQQ